MSTTSFLLGLATIPALIFVAVTAWAIKEYAPSAWAFTRSRRLKSISFEYLARGLPDGKQHLIKTVGDKRAVLAAHIALTRDLRMVGKRWAIVRVGPGESAHEDQVKPLSQSIAKWELPH